MRSILAILSGPFVYGLLCLPGNWLVVQLFPSKFDEQWITTHPPLLILLVSLTIIYSFGSGLACGLIAKRNIMKHAYTMSIFQLLLGIAIQTQYWDLLPIWYHLSFFVLLVVGILWGASRIKDDRT